MINRICFHIFLIFILFLLQSCEDDFLFNVQTEDFYLLEEIAEIDASSYINWVYFSLESGEVDILDPENSTEWDMAFKRNNIKTNGGLSSIEDENEIWYLGDVCAIVDSTQSWTDESFNSIEEIPNGECQTNELIEGDIITFQGCYNPGGDFSDCVKNPVLDHWGYFDDNYVFKINDYQFFVRGINGDYVKIWLMNYYNANGGGGYIYMKHLTLE